MPSLLDSVVIRPAVEADAEALARMAHALSRDQREREHKLTMDKALADGFGRGRAFESLVAELDGKPVGYASFIEAYETSVAARGFYLCDLYVEAACRRRGIGRALVAAVAAEAKARRKVYVWWVSKPWNAGAHAFYRALGATHEPVVAHAVFEDAFDQLAGEPAGSTRL